MTWGCEWGIPWGADCSPTLDTIQLTSGSWTFEAFYRFPLSRNKEPQQSLVRFSVTGSNADNFASGNSAPVLNVVALSGSLTSDPKLVLYARPSWLTGSTTNPNNISLAITGVNIFDGNLWNVSFGKYRNDDPVIAETGSLSSGSYFLRAARADRNLIREQFATSSFFLESTDNNLNNLVWQTADSNFNASGTFFEIGHKYYNTGSTGNEEFLNDETQFVSESARITKFQGLIGHIKFWSQGLELEEWQEHVRNFKSLGVRDPRTAFNFEADKTGSFGRLRIDANTDQIVKESDSSGEIQIFDFSQNSLHLTGSGFLASTEVITPQTFYFSHISPKFDEASTTNKIRSRGFTDYNLAKTYNAQFGIVNEIPANEMPHDDTRFTVDFSIIDTLDQDIIKIFSTLEDLDNVIGNPELLYSPDYPDLEDLRNIYFNRLTDNINLKSFFEFFKWFDRNIGHFIAALLPRKTKFRGVNFVIESHMLERAKFENLNVQHYLNENERHRGRDIELVRELEGFIKRY